MACATPTSVPSSSPCSSTLCESRPRAIARSITATDGVPTRAGGQATAAVRVMAWNAARDQAVRTDRQSSLRLRKKRPGKRPADRAAISTDALADLGPDLFLDGVFAL